MMEKLSIAACNAIREQIEQAIMTYLDKDELTESQSDYAADLAGRAVAEINVLLEKEKEREEERKEEALTTLAGIEDALNDLVDLGKAIGWLMAADYRDRNPLPVGMPVEEQVRQSNEFFKPFI